MDAFLWDPRFETHLEEVDGQHHRLVDLINAFSSRLGEQGELDPASLGSLHADLVAYARYHFDTEEKLMDAEGLDRRYVERHRQEHQDFCRHVDAGLAGPGAPPAVAAGKLLEYLVHWLTYHILGSDQSMARQIAALRLGTGPAQALEESERAVDAATATLLRSVTVLLDALSERNRELTALAQTLDARVVERTHELAAANGELQRLLEKVEQMALTDSLTGLPNRRYAMDGLTRAAANAARYGRPLSCLLIDADGFKQVNDQHGHEAGDGVLLELAATLRGTVRTSDEVCRLGGDEFLVIAPETALAGAMVLGERLRAAVAALRVPTGTGAWHGSISVGAADLRPELLDVQALLGAADRALYAAKHLGRNAVCAADEGGGSMPAPAASSPPGATPSPPLPPAPRGAAGAPCPARTGR